MTETENKTQTAPTVVVVAGISGAGKSSAIEILADNGFYAVSNLPVVLLEGLLEHFVSDPERYARTALLVEIDSQDKLSQLFHGLLKLESRLGRIELIYLDCSNDTVLRRYSETRRPHPVFNPRTDRSLEDTIARERKLLVTYKERANFILDTSALTSHDLKRELRRYLDSIAPGGAHLVRVNFVSFGFKHGLPPDCDLVADVRFLPNPYFEEGLRDRTGLEAEVSKFVMKSPEAQEFLNKYRDLLTFLLPQYAAEGKAYVNIGIGCTGGRHRSVALAQKLFEEMAHLPYILSVKHRDASK